MTAKSTKSPKQAKTSKATKTTKPSASDLAEMWKGRCYGTAMLLLVIIICLMLGGVWFYMNYKDNIVSDEDLAALEVFDEVSETFVNNFDLKDGARTYADVTEYGVSPDGDFYIGYKLNTLDDANNVTESKDGRVYFWTDDETGKRSYGFGYSD